MTAPSGAAAADTITLQGHGYGHGRGMGQWGALGYAVDHGWDWRQILGHFYGGTAEGSRSPGTVVEVVLRGMVGEPTVLQTDAVGLATSLDAAAPPSPGRRAVWIERTAASTYRIFDAPTCQGPWTLRGQGLQASVVIVDPIVTSDDPATMLQTCDQSSGVLRYLRGSVDVREFSTSLDPFGQQTVNRLRVDDYLRSVVPAETSPSWAGLGGGRGMHALRAQAVAARSYVLAGDSRWGPADASDDTYSQVYKGRGSRSAVGAAFVAGEAAATDQAIADTAGIVRTRDGAVARTEFSASTGGYTAGGQFPAVEDLGDDYADNPRHNWSMSVSVAAIEVAFDGVARRDLGSFVSLAVTARNGLGDLGGRAVSVVGTFSGGSATMSGDVLRSRLALHSDWFGLATPAWAPAVLVRPGTLTASPSIADTPGAARLDAFVRGTDGGVWWSRHEGSWQAWIPLGAPPTGPVRDEPAGVSWAPGRLDVFVRGSDDRLWQRFSTDGGATWSPWLQPIGTDGLLSAGPDVGTRGAGLLDVLVTGVDGAVYHRYHSPSGWSGSWFPLGGQARGRPSVAGWSAQRLDVFVRGTDDRLWQRFWDGSSWQPWVQPPGTTTGVLASSPDAASWAPGHLTVVTRGGDGSLYETTFTAGWRSWIRVGLSADRLIGNPSIASSRPEQLEVLVRGTDDKPYWFRFAR